MQIQTIAPDQVTRVDVRDWDPECEAYVKHLNAVERVIYYVQVMQYADDRLDPEERAEAGIAICVMALVDRDGNPLLTLDDVETIKRASFRPIDRIFAIINRQLEREEEDGEKKE